MKAHLAWVQALREPDVVRSWTLPQWEQVLRRARRLRLLARLGEAVLAADLIDTVPPPAARHLRAEVQLSRWRSGCLAWALERIGTTLADVPYPLVLLKGGAYIGQDLPIAAGRLPSDLDILVPQAHIADAQARLVADGWAEDSTLDAHDRRYYHEWSHEVPPMRHPVHPLELDLHHNILPPVAKVHVDAALLLQRLVPSRWPHWQVLHPQDQLLHSATHLFHDSEARDRLRDLLDLDGLMRHFGTDPGFWAGLPERAAELGLAEPLALACHFVCHWLDTPVPADTRARIQALGPGALRRAWLHPMWQHILKPTEPDSAPSWQQGAAAQLQLMRYHWGRMPLHLLLPHLWHKSRPQAQAADLPPQ